LPKDSRGTVLAISAWRIGMLIELARPLSRTYMWACHHSTKPNRMTMEKPKAAPAMTAMAVMTIFRRSRRSPSTPPQGPTNNRDTVLMPPTVTTNMAEDEIDEAAVRSLTSQPILRSWNHWAVLAQKLAVKRNRKSL